MPRDKDFVEEIAAERTRRNPHFRELARQAEERRQLLRDLANERQRHGLTQADVARRMRTSQPAVARLENGEIDPKLSTVTRYASVLGRRLLWRLEPERPRVKAPNKHAR